MEVPLTDAHKHAAAQHDQDKGCIVLLDFMTLTDSHIKKGSGDHGQFILQRDSLKCELVLVNVK